MFFQSSENQHATYYLGNLAQNNLPTAFLIFRISSITSWRSIKTDWRHISWMIAYFSLSNMCMTLSCNASFANNFLFLFLRLWCINSYTTQGEKRLLPGGSHDRNTSCKEESSENVKLVITSSKSYFQRGLRHVQYILFQHFFSCRKTIVKQKCKSKPIVKQIY